MSFDAVVPDIWAKVEDPPNDPIMSLDRIARAEKGPKANLVIGAYRDSEGLPYTFQVIRKAEKILIDQNLDHEYLPMLGNDEFIDAAVELLYAGTVPRENIVAVQTVGGTGAVFLGVQLLANILDKSTTTAYVPSLTWPNHPAIFDFLDWPARTYRYLSPHAIQLDFEGMKADIAEAPAGSVIVLQACAHNPTGLDPTPEQWESLAEVFVEKGHLAFFDTAYHGFATGDVDQDTFAVRLFARRGIQSVCAQSFSKNMGLYGERIGTFSVILKDNSRAFCVKGKMEFMIRRCYTTPPIHGARLVQLVLTNETLRKEWEEEIKVVSARIKSMRQLLVDYLKELKTPGTWEHVLKQIGMFSYLGLTKKQCDHCISRNVFITHTGRANMAGLTEKTAKLLAEAIHEAVTLEE